MKLAPPLPHLRVVAAVAATVVSGSLLMAPDAAHASPSLLLARADAPSAAVPTVTPATGGLGKSSVLLTNFPLAQVGYTQSEFLFSGTARSYTNSAPLT
ncbi:MAG: hypothetical protein JWL64_1009 [Frankiales bacterium]|nr:hypothetical protein [Frankiales bacterium]